MAKVLCGCSIGVDGGRGARQRRNSEAFHDRHMSLTMACFAVFAVALLAGVSAETSASTNRNLIINGDPVAWSDNQFFVRSWPDTVKETNDVLCGGSLIHSDIIITAAHCHGGFNYGAMAYDPETETLNQLKPVDLQIAYPKYYENLKIINYDVMIMRLASPITNVEPIMINSDPDFPLKRQNYDGDESYLLEGLGVGLTETGFISRGLEVGYFEAIQTEECAQRLGKVNVAMTDDIMCADPYTDDSICAGDSGGPLSAKISFPNENNAVTRSPWNDGSKPVLVGVTSFGNDCMVDTVPDGFARTSYFYEWINEQICKYSRDAPATCFEYYQSEEYLEFVNQQEVSQTIWPDKALMTLKFQHDFLAEQTVFAFRNTVTNDIAYVGPQYVPRRGEFVVSNFLLPVPGNYAIEIHDTGFDGLTNPKYVDSDIPHGNWTISAEYSNGARLEDLASGDSNFDELQTRFIRLPRRVKAPAAPTSAPTESKAPSVTPMPSAAQVDPESQQVSSASLSTCSAWILAVLSLGWTAIL